MSDLGTPDYIAQIRQKHATKPWGGAGASWIPEIVRLMIQLNLRHDPVTMLDYGAGRRTFANTMRWLMPDVYVSEYDPGVSGIDVWPPTNFRRPYHIVLCTDVMEHVEEQFVNATFKRIKEVTKFAVLFNIALTPSKSLLPNGANAHLTVKPADWWENEVMRVFTEINVLSHRKGYTFVAKP